MHITDSDMCYTFLKQKLSSAMPFPFGCANMMKSVADLPSFKEYHRDRNLAYLIFGDVSLYLHEVLIVKADLE